MAFDPRREDYLRLSLRFARSLDGMDPARAASAFAGFGRRFAHSRDSLPQTDEDRAFHLVADAATVIDMELPFAGEDQAASLIDRGRRLLNEAITLDPHSADASRMLAAADRQSFDAYYDFLRDGVEEVKARCNEACNALDTDEEDERVALELEMAQRPYVRWLATLASQAVICGRNREALRIAARVLETDPADGADVRFTAALACAKLEDEQTLDKVAHDWRAPAHVHGGTDAWMLLARAALAHKRNDLTRAREHLSTILVSYPHAAAMVVRQRELPDGVFSRLPAAPLSEDELILALSEGTVLLQEGREQGGRGAFGNWIAEESASLAAPWESEEVAQAQREVAEQMAELQRWEAAESGGYGQPGGQDRPGGHDQPGGHGNRGGSR